MKIYQLIFIATFLLLGLAFAVIATPQETCQQDNGWTKIDSDDLSSYPVSGATQYCFKAGSDNSQGCNGGLFTSWPQPEGTCGLSHWSYFIPQVTPTSPITPTNGLTPTIQPTSGLTPTPGPSNTPTPGPSATPGPGPTSTPAPVINVPQEAPKTGRGGE